jgi:RNA polymerase sigma-B factor
MALADGLRHLPPRERVILHLRFEHGLYQSEIAARLGISQMHVSRLISRALETLRRRAEGTDPP